jgi:hypothetical protein
MEISLVAQSHVCNEWELGAKNLAEACEKSGGEITGDQLKMMLARGERALLVARENNESKAWAVVQVQQLPNIRVFHVYSIYAPGVTTDEMFKQFAEIARKDGCSEIRGCVNDASARMWAHRFGAEKVYTTVRIRI